MLRKKIVRNPYADNQVAGGGCLTDNQYVINNTRIENRSFHKVTKAISLLSLLLLFLTSGNLFAQNIEYQKIDKFYYILNKDSKTAVLVRDENYKSDGNDNDKGSYSDEPTDSEPARYVGEEYKNIVIPAKVSYDEEDYTVTTIGKYAFYGSDITSVSAESDDLILKWGAFAKCESLTKFEMKVLCVTDNAGKLFAYNSALESIDLTITNNNFGGSYTAFLNCTSLKDLTIKLLNGKFLEEVYNNGATNIETVDIEASGFLDNMLAYLTTGLTKLKKINITGKSDIKTLEDARITTSNNKRSFLSENFGQKVTTDADITIKYCVLISNSMKEGAFTGNVTLSNCRVEGGSLGDSKFTNLTITDSSIIRQNGLSRTEIENLKIDNYSVTSLGNNGDFTHTDDRVYTATYPKDNKNANTSGVAYKDYDISTHGEIVDVNKTAVYGHEESGTTKGAKITHLEIGDNCYIAPFSFWHKDNTSERSTVMKSVKIGNNTYIARDALKGRINLESIEIGENCTFEIGVFEDCKNLKTLTIHSTKPPHFNTKLPNGNEAHIRPFYDLLDDLILKEDTDDDALKLDGSGLAQYATGNQIKIFLPCPSGYAYKSVLPWSRLTDATEDGPMHDAIKDILQVKYGMSAENAENSAKNITKAIHDNNTEHIYYHEDPQFGTGMIEYVEHTVLDNCDCIKEDGTQLYYDGDFKIKNGGSLSFKQLDKAKEHFEANSNAHKMILERDLAYDNWHLLGYMGNIPSDLTYGSYLTTTDGHDFAALPFVANDWQRKEGATGDDIYALADDKLVQDQSFMVWPFSNGWDDVNQKAKTEEISATPTVSIERDWTGLAEFNKYGSASKEGNYRFVLTNGGNDKTSEADPTGASTGYWFPLYNPYIGRLDIQAILAKRSSQIQGGYIYLFNPTAGDAESDWIAVNDSYAGDVKYITPARGFMVAGLGDNKDLDFELEYDMVSKEIGDLELAKNFNFKAGKQTNGMEFTIATDEARATATARYNAEASDGFDANDAYIMLSDGKDKLVEPYFVVDNRQIFDNHFSSLPYETEMRFHAAKQSHVDLTVSNIPASINVSVIDIATGEETQLTDGEKFSFVADEGENAHRYKVKFYNSGVSIEDVNNTVADVRFTQNDKRVTIFGEGLQNVEVVNTLGQVVSSESVSGNEAQITINGNAGAYIVRVKTSNGTAIEKFIVK